MEEQTKKCTKCGEIKPISEFNKIKAGKYGVNSRCKICCRKASLEYYRDPITGPKKKLMTAKWREANIEKVKIDEAKWREENREYLNKKSAEWIKDHPEEMKKYRDEHKEEIYDAVIRWRLNNPGKEAERYRERYKNDANFRLIAILRTTVNQYLKVKGKEEHSIDFLGCTIGEWRNYLEQQFLPEMNWDNHGKVWEIDHIFPLIKGGSFHYTNTQPLFKTTKIAKLFGYDDYIGNKDKKDKI